jgi:hypothetical protein
MSNALRHYIFILDDLIADYKKIQVNSAGQLLFGKAFLNYSPINI